MRRRCIRSHLSRPAQIPALALALLSTAIACHRSPTARAKSDASDSSDAGLSPATAERGTVIALLYASNMQGEYEHCGCPSHPLGGLVRRATVIDRARGQSDGVLIVDAGDMLLPEIFHSDKLRAAAPTEVERRARLVLSAYARMGINAYLPAERDLGVGPAKLKQLVKAFHIPTVASNLVDQDDRPLFDRDRIVTVAGVPIGIFGVVQPLPEDQALWAKWNVRATDPTVSARDEVASLKARGAKMIVALLHVGAPAVTRKLLEDVPGITWAVQGHAGQQLETPDTVGGARLVDAMGTGKLAGRLDIHVVDGTASFKDKGERAQMMMIVSDHRRQLADLQRRADEDKTNQMRAYYDLRKNGLTAAIEKETMLGQRLPPVIHGSWYENQIIPLDESIPDHPAVAMLVAAYNAENARRAEAGLPVGIKMHDPNAAVPMPPPPLPPGSAAAPSTTVPAVRYAGSAACAGCHEPAWRLYQTTKHAHALAALHPTKRDRDPTCVGCHVTGYLLPGGTTDISVATIRLKNVGCESCHGPSLEHVTSEDKKGTTHRQVAATVCRGCHTPDQTNGEFDDQSFRQAILGPGHGA
jgi:hypothetical protein